MPSVLYDEHVKLAGKSHMAAFAGYLMPLWYSSIAEEHRAVRQHAGLFDCTHMGVLEVSGPDAGSFLDAVSTNRVQDLKLGRAKYGYILDAAGNVLDDIIVYRRGETNFMVVVNAANESKIRSYLHELQQGRAVVDTQSSPWIAKLPKLKATIRDMRDPSRPSDRRADLALQGPASFDTLGKLTDASGAKRICELKSFAFVQEKLGGIDCLICRTGYTGSNVGVELFVDPQQAPRLWNLILEAGRPLGVLPCGLGSRDSLRIEAGLPLYGHELDGKFNISPFEAGYGWAVKLDKEFFIGQAAMRRVAETYDMEVARIELSAARGVRPIRQDDPLLDEQGECVGWVLSAAKAEDKQVALAYIDRKAAVEGKNLGVYYLARSDSQVEQGRKQAVQKGQKLEADLAGTVASRFAKF
ncbi:MAG: glycine cleavage system aminomethyltransferase GcvT [Planctomycetes bacterium]|nr:glycine cleavage system aminomethyltransferase GcvT [Planctomycetota bacterium]